MKDKNLVKRRSSEGIFIPVMPDTPPPIPIRNDYLPPPPADLSDENLMRLEIDTTRALGDNFLRPKTKIVDPKKKLKKITRHYETNLSEQLTKLFPKLDEVINEKKKMKNLRKKLKILQNCYLKLIATKLLLSLIFLVEEKIKILTRQCDLLVFFLITQIF